MELTYHDFHKLDFRGHMSASKSLFNRALIIQSYFPDLQIEGDSVCEDVEELKKALQEGQFIFQNKPLSKGMQNFRIGLGGTSLRFLLFRLSRLEGNFLVQCEESLARRPHEEICEILYTLGVSLEKSNQDFVIESPGWQKPQIDLSVSMKRSSQFASALVLNAWQLPFDLKFSVSEQSVSDSYFAMTLKMCASLGMEVIQDGLDFTIPKQQSVKKFKLQVEADMSSTFTLSCFAALFGKIEIDNMPLHSLQPDVQFLKIFEAMNIPWQKEKNILRVHKSSALKPIEVNLVDSPDLFPMLAVLCAFVRGKSFLKGASQLKYKESDRLSKIQELLDKSGVKNGREADGLWIEGGGVNGHQEFVFDPSHDHRLAMAAALLMRAGVKVRILHPEVVRKSYPEFWQQIGVPL